MWMSVFTSQSGADGAKRVGESWRLEVGWAQEGVKGSGAGGQDWWSRRRQGRWGEEGSSLGTMGGGEFSFPARKRQWSKAGCLRSENRMRLNVKTVYIMKSLSECFHKVRLCTFCITQGLYSKCIRSPSIYIFTFQIHSFHIYSFQPVTVTPVTHHTVSIFRCRCGYHCSIRA